MKEQNTSPSKEELYKLVKENNRMLKQMRRNAFIGGVLKFVWWVLILFVIPYFLYVTYLAPQLQALNNLYQNVENTNSSVQAQLEGLPDFSGFFDQFGGGQ